MKKKNILIITTPAFKKSWIKNLQSSFRKANLVFIDDNRPDIIKAVGNCDAMIGCPRYVFQDEDFRSFDHLEWIHAGGAGVEEFMKDSLKSSDVIFTNGKIIQGPEVADHAMSLILFFSRNINFIIKGKPFINRPIELKNKTSLIFGLGGIGICLAERLNAFGVKIDAITNDFPPILNCLNEVYFNLKDLRLSKYDIIVSTAPLTYKTKEIFNYSFFNKMAKDTIFINVSRGKLVKTNDLLKNNIFKKFRGIGLDVSEPEPLATKHKLRLQDNVFITPHIAGMSDYNRERGFMLIKENIIRYLNNQELLNTVNKDKEY